METQIWLETCDQCGKKVSKFIFDEDNVFCESCAEQLDAQGLLAGEDWEDIADRNGTSLI